MISLYVKWSIDKVTLLREILYVKSNVGQMKSTLILLFHFKIVIELI